MATCAILAAVAALTLFLFSMAICAYTLFGYPVLLWLEASVRRRPVRKAPLRATVTVILPVHNGERFLAAKLDSILRLNYPAELMDVLILSDGSTDGTDEIAKQYCARSNVNMIALPQGGKAAALNVGMAYATGEILFFTDVRQELDSQSLANLVECFSDPKVGAASGELIIRDGAGTEEASVGLYWKYEKWIRKQQSRIHSVMGTTGCIYAMRRRLAQPIPPGTLVDDMYLPLGAFFEGYRIILDDSAIAYDFPTQLASEFRRKVRTLAGVYQVIGQYPRLLTPWNRMWLHFLSHKFARLVMPWALLIGFFSSFALPEPLDAWAIALQVTAYSLAVLDFAIPDNQPLKRLTSPLRTFTVLMAASLCAISIFFLPARSLWPAVPVAPENPGGANRTAE